MRFLLFLSKVSVAMFATLLLADVFVRAAFPTLDRLPEDFSSAYLVRTIAQPQTRQSTVFLGDSGLWGYHVPARDAALSKLRAAGYKVTNLSFEGGSMANTYAMLRLMEVRGDLPRAVVFNVNLKEFNAADSAYQTLYPGLEAAVWPYLNGTDKHLLKKTQKDDANARLDRGLGRYWMLYGLRSDIRDQLFGSRDAATALQNQIFKISGEAARASAQHVPTPDRFLGTYDLEPISPTNVELVYLKKTVALLRRHRVPATAILTPTNHVLLHDYIDVPEYQAQLSTVSAVLAGSNVRILNFDHEFSGGEFIDNDHLTIVGNKKLAAKLRGSLSL